MQKCRCHIADITKCAIFWQFFLQSHSLMTLKIWAKVKSLLHTTPSHANDHLCQIRKNQSKPVGTMEGYDHMCNVLGVCIAKSRPN